MLAMSLAMQDDMPEVWATNDGGKIWLKRDLTTKTLWLLCAEQGGQRVEMRVNCRDLNHLAMLMLATLDDGKPVIGYAIRKGTPNTVNITVMSVRFNDLVLPIPCQHQLGLAEWLDANSSLLRRSYDIPNTAMWKRRLNGEDPVEEPQFRIVR